VTASDNSGHFCKKLQADPFILPPGLAGPRIKAILLKKEMWTNGKLLTYHFLENSGWTWTEDQKQTVRWGFSQWMSLGIGLRFAETARPDQAIIRIGNLPPESWSWVGRELERYSKPDGRNMNFGWDLRTPWGKATVLHEIGHAIGMPHEHQNPKSGIVWNEPAVYEYYESLEDPWEPSEIYDNVIKKLDLDSVKGSDWDIRSIMHYPTKAGLIAKPEELRINGTPENFVLSPNDILWAKSSYPPSGASHAISVGETLDIKIGDSDEMEFSFNPEETREYKFQTSGATDLLLELVKIVGDKETIVAQVDDSGTADNAAIVSLLEAGSRYVARARVIFADQDVRASLTIE
jgi:hypothetical protein